MAIASGGRPVGFSRLFFRHQVRCKGARRMANLGGVDEVGSVKQFSTELANWMNYRSPEPTYLADSDENPPPLIRRTAMISRRRRMLLLGCCACVAVCALALVAFAMLLVTFVDDSNRKPLCGNAFSCAVRIATRPPLFEAAQRARNITGLDGGTSQRVAGMENTWIWLFGDTVMNCTPHCGWGWRMVRNCGAVIRTDGNGSIVSAAFPKDGETIYAPQLIPEDWKGEGVIWPGGFSTAHGAWASWTANINWTDVAWGVGNFTLRHATSAAPVLSVHRVARDKNVTRPDWPVGAVMESRTNSSQLSIVNIRGPEDDRKAVLGTSTIRALEGGWERPVMYWNGKAFSSPPAEAVPLFNVPGPSISCLWHEVLHYACIMADWLGGNVVLRVADDLTGPWSEEYHILKTGGNPYAVYWHPELGKTYVFDERSVVVPRVFSCRQF